MEISLMRLTCITSSCQRSERHQNVMIHVKLAWEYVSVITIFHQLEDGEHLEEHLLLLWILSEV